MGYDIPGFSYLYQMGYMNNNLMITPMALVVVGVIIWIRIKKYGFSQKKLIWI